MSAAVVVLGVLALALPSGAAAARPRQGAELYATACLGCHGPLGSGTARGPSLRSAGALAADFYLRIGAMPLASPDDQPERGRPAFSDREIDALVAYVASLGHGPAIPKPHPDRGSVAQGQRLFTEHCAGCHQIAAAGGYVTGAVAPALDRATPTQVAEAVRMGPYLMPSSRRRRSPTASSTRSSPTSQQAKHPATVAAGRIGHSARSRRDWSPGSRGLGARRPCMVIGEVRA